MDLNWVKLQQYKRLVSTTLHTSGKVVAIVGSNEAGKSSVLQALQHLNHDNNRRFQPNELSRGNDSQNDEDVVIEAGFLLDDNDRAAISHLFQGDKVRRFKLTKLLNGTRKWEITPKPNRIAKQYNGDAKNLSELSKELSDPCKEIEEILIQRIPRILFFNEAQRDLRSTYELSSLVDGQVIIDG